MTSLYIRKDSLLHATPAGKVLSCLLPLPPHPSAIWVEVSTYDNWWPGYTAGKVLPSDLYTMYSEEKKNSRNSTKEISIWPENKSKLALLLYTYVKLSWSVLCNDLIVMLKKWYIFKNSLTNPGYFLKSQCRISLAVFNILEEDYENVWYQMLHTSEWAVLHF